MKRERKQVRVMKKRKKRFNKEIETVRDKDRVKERQDSRKKRNAGKITEYRKKEKELRGNWQYNEGAERKKKTVKEMKKIIEDENGEEGCKKERKKKEEWKRFKKKDVILLSHSSFFSFFFKSLILTVFLPFYILQQKR